MNAMVSAAILENRDRIADAVVESSFGFFAKKAGKYDPNAPRFRGYVLNELCYLAHAISADHPPVFKEYVVWLSNMLGTRGIDPKMAVKFVTERLRESLKESLPPEQSEVVEAYIDAGMAALEDGVEEPAPFVSPGDGLAHDYLQAVLKPDRRAAADMIIDAVDAGMGVAEVYLEVFEPVQREIGRLWQMNRISVAREHTATAITQMVMSRMYPRLFGSDRLNRTMVAACSPDELHEVGLRIVTDLFEMGGWDTHYVGANTPLLDLVDEVSEREAQVLALSATMMENVHKVEKIIEAVKKDGPAGLKIMVGGMPFNLIPGLSETIGADLYARDAKSALESSER